MKEEGPLKRIVSPADRIPGSRRRSFLAKYNPATGISERLTFGNHSTYLNDISPDGKYILYSTSKENITERPFSLSSLYQVNLEHWLSIRSLSTTVLWEAPVIHRMVNNL